MTARSLTNRILLAVSLLSLVAAITTAHASSAETDAASPPAAQIIYSASMKADYEYKLFLANWPNPKPKELNPKVIGKYGLGDIIIDPLFSPDGSKVLFLANRKLPNGKQVETDGYIGNDLWILDLRANTLKPLTTDGHGYEQHQWSPDGIYVCAISHEGRAAPEAPSDLGDVIKNDLFVWDTLTGKHWFIAKHVGSVVWSKDSRSLYYSRSEQEPPCILLKVNRNGGKPTVILEGDRSVRFLSPDQKQYVSWDEGREGETSTLYVMDLATGKRRTIRKSNHEQNGGVRWLPDGQGVTIWLYDGHTKRDDVPLGIVDIATGEVEVSRVKGISGVWRWSRDLNWIITEESAATEMDTSRNYLLAASVKTGKHVTLIHPPQAGGFDWHELPSR